MSPEDAERLSQDFRVKYVEEDGVVTADATQSNPPWGLDRIDQRNRAVECHLHLQLDRRRRSCIRDRYRHSHHPHPVWRTCFERVRRVWWQRTGLQRSRHSRRRHDRRFDFRRGEECVAAWRARAQLLRLRFKLRRDRGCRFRETESHRTGSCEHESRRRHFECARYCSEQPSNAGVTIAVAAGNSNANACNSSPARAANAITVGSTTTTDARSSFSNFGTCLDIFAPGSGILSAWFTSNTATATLSGTSMASPHVAGVAALYKQANPSASSTTIRNAIVNNATTNVVTNAGTGSPNRLLYSLFF